MNGLSSKGHLIILMGPLCRTVSLKNVSLCSSALAFSAAMLGFDYYADAGQKCWLMSNSSFLFLFFYYFSKKDIFDKT